MPKKKRVVTRPANDCVAAMQQTTVPKPTMMQGKYLLPENLFITKFDGMSRRVTMK